MCFLYYLRICSTSSTEAFKRRLKTFLFNRAFSHYYYYYYYYCCCCCCCCCCHHHSTVIRAISLRVEGSTEMIVLLVLLIWYTEWTMFLAAPRNKLDNTQRAYTTAKPRRTDDAAQRTSIQRGGAIGACEENFLNSLRILIVQYPIDCSLSQGLSVPKFHKNI